MSLFNLIKNTAEGAAQIPLTTTKTLLGAALAPLDDCATMKEGAQETVAAIKKIGKLD